MPTTIHLISEILDHNIQADDDYLHLIRVSKVQEEAGEAMAAAIAYLDINPRKPHGELQQLVDELADVALTAMCAIEHFGWDAVGLVNARSDYVYRRLTNG